MTINSVYDIAWNQIKGQRYSQQDSVACVRLGSRSHLCVLADGMGGRAGGDVASALAVGSFCNSYEGSEFSGEIAARLRSAAESANHAIRSQVIAVPELAGMGTTITAIAIDGTTFNWISVGDSPLWLIRRGRLRLVNSDRVQSGIATCRGRANSRLRRAGHKSLAFEAMTGERLLTTKASTTSETLILGDVLLGASDGIDTCGDDELLKIVHSCRESAAKTVDGVLTAVEAHDDEYQDNATVIAVRVTR